jgi:uncharacterized PurR-regulated membrane protein YhhQ (DUF165 family)
VLESFACFIAISAWIYIVLTAMKRGDEELNTSSLQFLRSIKRFIASSLHRFIASSLHRYNFFSA